MLVSVNVHSAWDEKFYNPQPLENDVILPMPCDGNMVFRMIKSNTKKPLDDTPIILGGNTGQEGYAEYATPNYIAGSFTDKNGERYFLMAKYEVTLAQYQSVMEQNCSKPNMKTLLPVHNISWFDAVQFSQRYNEWLLNNAKDLLPQEDGTKGFVRLPTNTEWEFASRGGMAVTPSEFRENTFPIEDGLQSYAWFNDAKSANGRLQLIGRLKPNPLGLFDTLGNVSEMMFDSFKANKLDRYHGQEGGITSRGGSYLKTAANVNNVIRLEIPFYDQNGAKKAKDMGFRVAIVAPLLTSTQRIKQLNEDWQQLGKQGQSKKEEDAVDKLDEIAKNTSDEKLKQELTKTKDLLRAANLERDEQRDSAIRATLELGTFLCANVSELNEEDKQNKFIMQTANNELDGEMQESFKIRVSETEQSLNIALKHYADTIVATSSIYLESSIKAQLNRTEEVIKLRGKSNLTNYLELHWKHLRQYYQTGKVERATWLQQCSQIKHQ